MWAKLEKVFNQIGLEYSRQGSYSDASEYPESFFTFWNFDAPDEGFYDNKAKRTVWLWQVYYYTRNPATLYTMMDEFIRMAKAEGFVTEGRGKDIPSDRPDYPGRMITIKYLEEYLEKTVVPVLPANAIYYVDENGNEGVVTSDDGVVTYEELINDNATYYVDDDGNSALVMSDAGAVMYEYIEEV